MWNSLGRHTDGDRQFVGILGAMATYGLDAVAAACAEVLTVRAPNREVVLTESQRRAVNAQLRAGALVLLYMALERLLLDDTLDMLADCPLAPFAIDEASRFTCHYYTNQYHIRLTDRA